MKAALLTVLLAGTVPAAAVAAQGAAPSRTAWWGSIGLGLGYLAHEAADIGAHVGGSFQFGSNLVSVRAASASSIIGALVNAISGQPGVTDATDYGILYGRATAPRPWYASGALGVGLAKVQRDSAGTSTTSWHFTVPVEAQVAWRPLESFGVVFCGFASFNGGRTFGGATLGLQLGRLR